MTKKKILFLGETFRADAITWMNGLKEFGDFEIVTWELKNSSKGLHRAKRLIEILTTILTIKSIVKKYSPDMVIAERTTSYGFLASICGVKPIAIAQQGITDLWPTNSPLVFLKKIMQNHAFKKADLIHAWGMAIAVYIKKCGVDMSKVLVLPKGINVATFRFDTTNDNNKINAVVTRSLEPEYKHDLILKAFSTLKKRNIPFQLTIVGDGTQLKNLKSLTKTLNIENDVVFTGRIHNNQIPDFLVAANFYISTPETEGVSASLFEAMACGCFPIVSDLPGNRSWIQQQENGILVEITDESSLVNALEWSFKENEITKKAILQNRKFIEENVNYKINMTKIAKTYHELISSKKQIL